MRGLALWASLALAAPALAADPEPESGSSEPAAPEPSAGGVEADAPPSRLAFDAALKSLDGGDLYDACRRLKEITVRGKGTVEATWAGQIGRAIQRLDDTSCTWAGVGGTRALDSDGQLELILSQALVVPTWLTAAPVAFGAQIDSPAIPAVTILGGLALGIGGTYALTENFPVTRGQAMTIYGGEVIGTWYGIVGEVLASDTITVRPALVGTVVGGVGGAVLGGVLKPSEGDAALVLSAGRWGTAFGGITALIALPDNEDGVFGLLGAGTTIGLGTGAILTSQLELRRNEMRIVDLGGYAGALSGGAVLLLIGGDLTPEAAGATLGLSTGAGLVVGALIVKNRRKNASMARRPGAVHASAPVPTMMLGPDGESMPGLSWSGRF